MPARTLPIRRRRHRDPPPLPAATLVHALATGPHPVIALAFSPSGHYLAAALQHGPIALFRLTAPAGASAPRLAPTRLLRGHGADVQHLSFSRSDTLASAAIDRTARVWHPATGACLRVLNHPDKVVCAAFDPDDPAALLTATAAGTASLTRLSDRVVLARAAAPPLAAAAFVPYDRSAALATRDGRLLHWAPRAHAARTEHGTPLRKLSLEPVRRTRRRRGRGDEVEAAACGALALGATTRGDRALVALCGDGRRAAVRGGSDPHTTDHARAPVAQTRLLGGAGCVSADGRFSVLDARGACVRLVDAGKADAPGRDGFVAARVAEVAVPGLRARGASVCSAAFAPDAAAKRARRDVRRVVLLGVGGTDGSVSVVEQRFA